jgi:hypothetical protein
MSTSPPRLLLDNITNFLELPVELLERVLMWACTDGGRTGAALAVSSRGLRALSSQARYHSVGLKSIPQIRLFASGARLRPQKDFFCEHLLVHTKRDEDFTLDARLLSLADSDSTYFDRLWEAGADAEINHGNRVHGAYVPVIALFEIVRLLSPNLRSLAMITNKITRSLFEFVPFPRLRDLVWNACPLYNLSPNSMPVLSLRRLHLVQIPTGYDLAHLAPNMLELRLHAPSYLAGFALKSISADPWEREYRPPPLRYIQLDTDKSAADFDRGGPWLQEALHEVSLTPGWVPVYAKVDPYGHGGMRTEHMRAWERLVWDGVGPWFEVMYDMEQEQENLEDEKLVVFTYQNR